MKQFRIAAITFLSALTIASCEDAAEALDVDINGDISKSITIEIPEQSGTMEDDIEFELNSNEEFEKYGDKIKSVNLDYIKIFLNNMTVGDSTTTLALSINVPMSNGTDAINIEMPATTVVTAVNDDVAEVEFEFSGDQAQALGADILSSGKISISLSGIYENGPLTTDVEFKVGASITAAPLQ